MDWKDLLTLALTVGLPLVMGYVTRLRTELTEFRVTVAEKYVKNERLDKIEEALARIEGLLHTKADKKAYREGV